MTTTRRILLLAAFVAAVPHAGAQTNERDPRVGYLYPAGGRQGTSFEITAGGQKLAGVSDALVTGEGVRVSVVQWYRPIRNLDKEQRDLLQKRLEELRDKRLAEAGAGRGAARPDPDRWPKRRFPLSPERSQANPNKIQSANPPESAEPGQPPERQPGEGKPFQPRFGKKAAGGNAAGTKPGTKPGAGKSSAARPVEVKLPAHPLLDKLDQLDLRQLREVANEFLKFRTRQMNPQIAELVVLRVTIDPGAAPGDRELRLLTPAGLSNPICFQVGVVPEAIEEEPNDPQTFSPWPTDPPAQLPVVFNGQIRPGDVDRFRFNASRGQHLVVTGRARRLIPYLADAVPGWFQATIALYDAAGKEIAFADDYRFDPDPVLFFEVPANGVYELEIRDSIFRGREDFVYRVTVGEQPFVRRMFPLGGGSGRPTVAAIDGWNLPAASMPLDTQAGGPPVRQFGIRRGIWVSDSVPYAVGSLPECTEASPDTTTAKSQAVTLPCVVNGRIGRPGDVDVFEFAGRAGQEIVAEVQARCYRSPMDSLLRLTDLHGKVVAMNDDCENKESGLETHHADSYLRVRLPADGAYRVQLSDAQRHGGEDYAYRLRLGPPQPDYALRATPSSLSIPAGQCVPLTVYAVRKDGFDGPIDLVMRDAPEGFVLTGGRIPAGQDRLQVTLGAPRGGASKPVALQIDGRARLGPDEIVRPVVPAEDRMQAFLYRHLTPSQQLLATVLPGNRQPSVAPAEGGSLVRIPLGGSADLDVPLPRWFADRGVSIELIEPPVGVTIETTRKTPRGVAAVVAADAKATKPGASGNLIVEVFADPPAGLPALAGKKAQGKKRFSLGVWPAIPYEIVAAPAPVKTSP